MDTRCMGNVRTLLTRRVLCGFLVYGKCTLVMRSVILGYTVYTKLALLIRCVLCGYSMYGKRTYINDEECNMY